MKINLIRVCQLQAGDIFVRLGNEYYVSNIKGFVKCYINGTRNHIKLGTKSQEWVNLIGKTPSAKYSTIIQCDNNGRALRTWTSLEAACIETNTNRIGVMRCLNGFQRMANGFIWKRA